MRELCGRALRGFGYEVLSARTGKEAIAIAAANRRVDLLMTDVVLPDMRGTQLAELIAQSHPNLHILYASGYTDDIINPGRDSAGTPSTLRDSTSLLQKPYTPTQLAAAVRQLLDVRR